MALAPCPSCTRHVRVPATSCPFCAAILPEAVVVRSTPRARLGRAAIFAFGGAALASTAGCYEHHLRDAPPPEPHVRDAAPLPLDAAIERDVGAPITLYGGPPPDVPDAGVDAGFDAGESVVPAYGGPFPFPEEDAGADAGGAIGVLYGGAASSE